MTNNDNQNPMSEKKAAMEAAIEAYMAEEYNETVMLDGYILQVSAVTPADSKTALMFCAKDRQSGVTTLGLLQYLDFNVQNDTFGKLEGEL